jgi:hypothetical protein
LTPLGGVRSDRPKDLEPSGWPVLLVAIPAIHWPRAVWLEGNLGFLTALGACYFMHLTGSAIETAAPSVSGISVSFHTIFFLFSIYEGPLLAALKLNINVEGVYNGISWSFPASVGGPS